MADSYEDDFEHVLPSRKRQRLEEDPEAEAVSFAASRSASPAAEASAPAQTGKAGKRKRKAQAAKAKKQSRFDADDDQPSIALAELPLQADYLAERQTVALQNATGLEKDEIRLKEGYLVDATETTDRAKLAGFVQAALPSILKKLSKTSKKNGSPRILVVAAAAMRVADLCRDAKALTGGAEVAKLLAKHFKLDAHIEHCKKAAFSAAVGTPDRIAKLLEADALSLDSTEYLILDTTFRNEKGRNLFEQPETRDSLFTSVLSSAKVLERLEGGKMKLVLF